MFVIAQLAMAMLLLTGAGLLIKALVRGSRLETGYETAHLVRADLPLDGERHRDPRKIGELARQIQERLSQLPGTVATLSETFSPAGPPGSTRSSRSAAELRAIIRGR